MNGVKLADILFLLLFVCLSVCLSVCPYVCVCACLCALSVVFNIFSKSSQALSNCAVFWRIYALSERLLVLFQLTLAYHDKQGSSNRVIRAVTVNPPYYLHIFSTHWCTFATLKITRGAALCGVARRRASPQRNACGVNAA